MWDIFKEPLVELVKAVPFGTFSILCLVLMNGVHKRAEKHFKKELERIEKLYASIERKTKER